MPSDDVNVRGILAFLGILVLTVITGYFGIAGLARAFERTAQKADEQAMVQEPSASLAATRPYFPLPREQPAPRADLEALRAQEDRELNSYGWVDKSNGVVRIPIDRAIEVLTPLIAPR